MRYPIAILMTVLATLFASTSASAQKVIAPPGNSAIGEYVETIPSASGPMVSRPSHKPTTGGSTGLSHATQQALTRSGQDGQDVLDLVASAPSKHAKSKSKSGSAGKDSKNALDQQSLPRQSPASIIVKSLGGSSGGGMGILLPLMLALTLVVAGVLAVRRRKT